MVTDLANLFRIKKSHIKPAAAVVARAFQDNAIFVHCMPDADTRKQILHHLFQFRLRCGVLYGEVYAISPNLEGLAVWFPSKHVQMSLWQMLRAGGFGFYLKAGDKLAATLHAIEEYILSFHRRLLDFPYWHLSPLAVDPPFQGRGHATALLKAMFARTDRENLPCFLETQNARSMRFYKRFGFRVIEKGVIPGTEIPHWAMLRESR
ncbi:MAG: GNAT family N-acetyltransferase [Deltaproteobacteria bacterium]|nr:GNAT family N-acetyltransferase [Deltaproteobacteria bacterium]